MHGGVDSILFKVEIGKFVKEIPVFKLEKNAKLYSVKLLNCLNTRAQTMMITRWCWCVSVNFKKKLYFSKNILISLLKL